METTMRHMAFMALSAAVLAATVWAGPQKPAPQTSIHCTLVDKNVKKCCCLKRGDKLYCTLAKKTIEKCCCQPPQSPK